MSFVNEALTYARLGWSVVPINPERGKIPFIKWKPYQTQRATEAEIRQWWAKWPNANIGIITGHISGIAVVDIDSPEAALALDAALGGTPPTMRQTTGRVDGGQHLVYRLADDQTIRNTAGLIENVDIRGEGGLFVVAPSIHKSGAAYRWDVGDPLAGDLSELADLPQCILDLYNVNGPGHRPRSGKVADLDTAETEPVVKCGTVKTSSSVSKQQPGKPLAEPRRIGFVKSAADPNAWVNDAMLGVEAGERNHIAARLAGYMAREAQSVLKLKTEEAKKYVLEKLIDVWNPRNNPPMEPDEIRQTVESIFRLDTANAVKVVLGVDDRITIKALLYPDQEVVYRFSFGGRGVDLTSADILSFQKFSSAIMQLTVNGVLHHVKSNEQWRHMVQMMLSEVEVIHMSEDETLIGVVRDIIRRDIARSIDEDTGAIETNPTPQSDIDVRAVIDRDKVAVKVGAIAATMAELKLGEPDRKSIGRALQLIGFNAGVLRMSPHPGAKTSISDNHRCYYMPAAEFIASCVSENPDE